MLLILRSTVLSSGLIAILPFAFGPVAAVPPGVDPAEPVVVEDPARPGDPDELAVPALLVPGAGGWVSFTELPAPVGSLTELFKPPALAGPDGTPLTPAVPAPAEPAFGEPAGLALPAAPPPPACANELTGNARMTSAASVAVIGADSLDTAKLLSEFNDDSCGWFRAR
jgi:hypothetical protein